MFKNLFQGIRAVRGGKGALFQNPSALVPADYRAFCPSDVNSNILPHGSLLVLAKTAGGPALAVLGGCLRGRVRYGWCAAAARAVPGRYKNIIASENALIKGAFFRLR